MSTESFSYNEAKKYFAYNPETGEILRKADGKKALTNAGNNNYVVKLPSSNDARLQLSATRLAYLLMTGKLPVHPIYCKDGNRKNLIWSNLIESKPGSNMPSKKSGTGVCGIYKIGNSYVIRTTFNNVPIRVSSSKHSLEEMKEILKLQKMKIWNELLKSNVENELKTLTIK